MRLINILALAATAFTCLSALAAERATETFTYELNEGGRISIENVNGDIEITGGPGNSVEITADKSADDAEDLARLKVEIKADPDSIRIETVYGKSTGTWFSTNNSGEVNYTLRVPVNVNLDAISTVNGGIRVEGISGSVQAESVNGDLELRNLAGDADLETTNGGIDASFDLLEGRQRVNADTVNGRVTLLLPDSTSARVSAETLNGGIDASDFGLDVDERSFVGKELKGNIGEGEARIDLDTVNGGIRIRKK